MGEAMSISSESNPPPTALTTSAFIDGLLTEGTFPESSFAGALHGVIFRKESLMCPRHRCYNSDALEVSIWNCHICATLLESVKSSTSVEQPSGSTSHCRRFPAKFKIWKKRSDFLCSTVSLAA